MTSAANNSTSSILSVFIVFLTASLAWAHPLSQGSLDIVIHSGTIMVHARVTAEEVQITNSSTGDSPLPGPWAAAGSSAFQQHAEYLAAHLHLSADGVALTGRVISVTPPDGQSASNQGSAAYELEYPLPVSSPKVITVWQNTLGDAQLPAGQSWATLYLVTISQAGQTPTQWALPRDHPMNFICSWQQAPTTAQSADRASLFKSYVVHGINHILGEPVGAGLLPRSDVGFDHLLFVSALVLGTRSLWDLFKIVTAFTIAHTLTLTLAALNLVHCPESISEPMIAASIVFVALQNVFWPRQSHGPWRFAAAFFFGLFHGLGFAGGLLETMKEMRGGTVLVAIVAFSIGVELGHQFVVLPLFAVLKIARETRATPLARDQVSLSVQKFGSAFISLAGLFYLVVALKMCFSARPPL